MNRAHCLPIRAESLGLDVDNLVAQHLPAFLLHPQELYLPCSVEWFLQHCFLTLVSKGRPVGPVVIPTGQVTPQALHRLQLQLQSQDVAFVRERYALWVEEQHWGGQPVEQLQDVPVYAHVKVIQGRTSHEPEALEINYITLYAYNGAYHLYGIPALKTGYHVGDIEHVTVRFNLTRNADHAPASYTACLAGVWYNSHRNREGEWVAAADVPHDPQSGRIAAYVAINGHGLYPKAGTILRMFSAANDRTSARGPVWRPASVVLMHGLDYGCSLPVVWSRGCSLVPAPQLHPSPHSTCLGTSASSSKLGVLRSKNSMVPRELSGVAGSKIGVHLSDESQTATTEPQTAQQTLPDDADTVGSAAIASTTAVNMNVGAGGMNVVMVDGVRVVHDTEPWQLFTGSWGTAEAFALQCWFRNPEPPVSRTWFQRWCCPCAGEVECIPDPV